MAGDTPPPFFFVYVLDKPILLAIKSALKSTFAYLTFFGKVRVVAKMKDETIKISKRWNLTLSACVVAGTAGKYYFSEAIKTV